MKLPALFRPLALDASARIWHRLWSVRLALASALARVVHQPAAQSRLDADKRSRTC